MTDPIDAVMTTLDRYFDALNAQDSDGMRAQFHFPHYRFSTSGIQVYDTPESYGIGIFLGRGDTQGWAYTRWDHRNVIQAGTDKVHLDVQFSRYRADDSVLGVYKSLWIVTRIDGRWGVQVRSSYAE